MLRLNRLGSFIKQLLVSIFFVFFVAGCVSSGTIIESRDEFTAEKHKTLVLGQLTSLKRMGVIYEISGTLTEVTDLQGGTHYELNLSSYVEKIGGEECPAVSKGAKVIFFMPATDERAEYTVLRETNKMNNQTGILAAACHETIKVGPLEKSFVESLGEQSQVKFKVFGTRFDLEGKIVAPKLRLIQKFVSTK